jgi:L-seryl-tRNA(Ser) seleniumtransferase
VLGRAELVERLRRHPLQRALRIDKLSLAALEGTLLLHLEAPERIPVLRTLAQASSAVRERAERLAAATGGEVEETVGRVGGGALPLAELPSFACALRSRSQPLRAGRPPSSASSATAVSCSTA